MNNKTINKENAELILQKIMLTLKINRLNKGITLDDIADVLGGEKTRYSKLENAKTTVPLERLIQYMMVLDIDILSLFESITKANETIFTSNNKIAKNCMSKINKIDKKLRGENNENHI